MPLTFIQTHTHTQMLHNQVPVCVRVGVAAPSLSGIKLFRAIFVGIFTTHFYMQGIHWLCAI